MNQVTLAFPVYVDYLNPEQLRQFNPNLFAKTVEDAPDLRKLTVSHLINEQARFLNPVTELFKKAYPSKLTSVDITLPEAFIKHTLENEINLHFSEFLKHVASKQLTKVTLNDRSIASSCLNTEILSEFLRNCPNLKKIHIKLEHHIKDLTLHFRLCPKLEKIKMTRCGSITKDTFDSIQQCKKLHSLVFDDFLEVDQLRDFLYSSHKLPLRKLQLGSTPLLLSNEDLIMTTKELPELRAFNQTRFFRGTNQITDQGLIELGVLCPKLAHVSFCFDNITDLGLSRFVSQTPLLETLKIIQGYQLGEQSLIALANHCPKLKFLSLNYFKEVTEPGLRAITECCHDLEQLEITSFEKFSIEGLVALLESAAHLKSVTIWPIKEEFETGIFSLRSKYTHINWSFR